MELLILLKIIVFLTLLAVYLAGIWYTLEKAGQPGWAILVPIYNLYVLVYISGRPIWWMLLLLIPYVNAVIAIVIHLDIARNFGKGILFGLGLAFLPIIFYPILGFGNAQYRNCTCATDEDGYEYVCDDEEDVPDVPSWRCK